MRCYTALTAAAALLLLLPVPLAAAAEASAETSIAPYTERSEEETRRVFAEWMAKHDMTYDSAVEEERRYAIFKYKLRIVEQHNAEADAGIQSYRLGLNWLSDRFSAEMYCGCGMPVQSPRTKINSRGGTIPGETKQGI